MMNLLKKLVDDESQNIAKYSICGCLTTKEARVSEKDIICPTCEIRM